LAAASVEYWLAPDGVPEAGVAVGFADAAGVCLGVVVADGAGDVFTGAEAVDDPALHSLMKSFFFLPLA